REYMSRYGRLLLEKDGDVLLLKSEDPLLLDEISKHKKTKDYIDERLDPNTLKIGGEYRGHLKQDLIKIGFPVKDKAGYVDGEAIKVDMRHYTGNGKPFVLRDYQRSAVSAFYRDGSTDGGSGVIVLPCGAGKTVIGLGAMACVKRKTLILVTNIVALHQWKREI